MVTLPPKGPVNVDREAKELKEIHETIKKALSGKSRAALEAENEAYKSAEAQWDADRKVLEGEVTIYKGKEATYKATDAENKKLGRTVGELEGKASELEGKASELEGKVGELEGKASELEGDLDICGKNTDAYKALYQQAKAILKEVVQNL